MRPSVKQEVSTLLVIALLVVLLLLVSWNTSGAQSPHTGCATPTAEPEGCPADTSTPQISATWWVATPTATLTVSPILTPIATTKPMPICATGLVTCIYLPVGAR